MTIAVVPMKDLDGAKKRLSSCLSSDQRRALVLAMLEDVLDVLSRSPGVSGTMVVTREPEIAKRAARFGAEILDEPENQGHTAAVDRAIRELERRKVSTMLCVPGDVPAITPDEVATIIKALGSAPAVVLAPSRNERGTNAVFASPPSALPLRFGEPSFLLHLNRARELRLRAQVLHLPGVALDLDTPEDLDFFQQAPSPTVTYRFLQELAK